MIIETLDAFCKTPNSFRYWSSLINGKHRMPSVSGRHNDDR